jgi:two-component system response regulator AtoC
MFYYEDMIMNLLIVDDERELREKIARFCGLEDDIAPFTAENGLSAQRILEQKEVDLVVTDLNMPGMDGLDLLKWIQQEMPAIPVVIMSGYGEIPDAVEAMKLGAQDYIVKPFDLEAFLVQIKQIFAHQDIQKQIETGKHEGTTFNKLIGESPALLEIQALVEKIAPTSSTILITGESGTGKEVVARMIHHLSPRAENPFVALNLGGIPETLLESELFGHEKGSFTGAIARKIGMFELASSGTLFLDEIAEIPLHLQVKLLRVLQEREIQRVGGTQSLPIDVRILAATNKNLEEQIQQGLFREDLYYRLNIIKISLPPLRDRKEDIPLLAGHFLSKFSPKIGKSIQGIDQEAVKTLQSYNFPGNVRELENIIERAIIFAKTEMITLHDLGLASSTSRPYVKKGTLSEMQKYAIIEALRRWEGNRTRAAEELGINRKTLLNKIKEYGLKDV